MSAPISRPSARAPRGFADRRAGEVKRQRAILEAVSKVYEAHGFEALETSAFEYADALGKFLPDADRPNEGVFALTDDDEQWMALRYDLTAPLARFAAQNWETLPKPFRRYAFGTVWRNEKPGPGRFREFVQCDADTVGSARPEADAEIVAMAVAGFEAAGLPAGAVVLRINHRKLLDSVIVQAGVVEPGQKLGVMRTLDKMDKLPLQELEKLLGKGRLDESGAFVPGVGLDPAAIATLRDYMAAILEPAAGAMIDRIAGRVATAEGEAALADVAAIEATLRAMGVGAERARFDPSIVRGLEYYTGAVFEADLLLETRDDKGQAVRFGSVGGGGRYDDLVARFTGQRTPATGFSFGVSRLSAALAAAGRVEAQARGPVVVIAFNRERMADYFAVAAELRGSGIAAEVYLGESGMKAQMKYADRRLAPAAVILGDDEIAAGAVTVKDLDLGRDLARDLSDNAAWKAERPGQATIPRAELIAFVKRIVGG